MIERHKLSRVLTLSRKALNRSLKTSKNLIIFGALRLRRLPKSKMILSQKKTQQIQY